MSKSREKLAFGVFLDGNIVKIAQLALIDGRPIVQRLEQKELSSPLYPSEEFQPIESFDFEEPEDFPMEEQLSEPDLMLPDFDDIDLPTEVEENFAPPGESGIKDLQGLIQSFLFEKGRVALNANDEQISYHLFDSSFTTSKLLKKLKSELLTKEELKSKNFSIDYIFNPNNTGLAFVHRGSFELLEAVKEINSAITKEKFLYSNIDTNEICLMNLIKNCYDLPPEDYITILYIGKDYKVGIVMKGDSHIKTFPIIVTDSEPEKMRSAIYSKIILEQDVSNLPITQHVILVGDYVSDEDVDFYQDKGFYWDPLRRIQLTGLETQADNGEEISETSIAQYAIPIALAWKTLDPRNEKFFHSNLLPSKIIENQKYFKIAWHGFLVLTLIFFVALYGTVNSLKLQQSINKVKVETRQVENELRETKRLIDNVNIVKYKMSDVEDKLVKVKEITGFRNQWGVILRDISGSLRRNSLSWLEVLESSGSNEVDSRFQISGFSTAQRNIVKLSNLFPNCQIDKVSSTEVQENKIWSFSLNFSYPEVSEKLITIEPESKPTPQPVVAKPEVNRVVPKAEPIAQEEAVEPDYKNINDPMVAYDEVIELYFRGDTDGSLAGFQNFLEKYPNHARAYNAKYFIGECYYHMAQYQKAIPMFEEIVLLERGKRPDAMMMLGNCYEKTAEMEKAISNWQNLVNKFPNNNLTKLARYKIESYREN